MLKYVLAAIMYAGISGFAPVQAASSAPTFTGGLLIDSDTRYVWRGIALSSGAVIQPSAWISRGNTTVTIWGDQTLTQDDGSHWDETDYTLSYVAPCRAASLEADIVRYTYQHQPGVPDTAELISKITVPFANWGLFTDQNIDVGCHPGSVYAEFGANRSWNLSKVYAADTTATFGVASAEFNAANIGPHKAAINMLGLDFGVARSIDSIVVRTHITYTTIIDKDLRSSLSNPDNLVFGISMERDW